MEQLSGKRFPTNPKDYKIYEEVGEGVSATVYRALCIPLNEIVAIKVLDLEKCNNDLDGIRREVQTMSLINHPNLVRAHCSFATDQSLWVVMPYMAEGSCLHIMKTAYPEGFEEPVIATLLREVLKALVYLHGHGHIHRDVKAGNILVDINGAVKLADFGVSACMFDTGDRQRSRNTFVGTPCWMAPEVMQQLHGYDFKADIWSFGITALELAHGHAPFSKYPPMKVLLMTLQNAPPGLDYERDKRFSKSFKELVGACLVKDPKKRPSSEKLLKHPFFKHARTNDYLARTILDGLSPLGQRFRVLRDKEAGLLVQNKLLGDKEQLSQQEYIRGISAWNFNLEDLKNQAAQIQDPGGISNADDSDTSKKVKNGCDVKDFALKLASPEKDEFHDLQIEENSLASTFPVHSLQALKGCFDVVEDEEDASSPSPNCKKPDTESMFQLQNASQVGVSDGILNNGDVLERKASLNRNISAPGQRPRFLSGPLMPELGVSSKKVVGDSERDELQQKNQSERNYSGTLFYRQMKEPTIANVHELEEGSEGRLVQHKGRFKVTSADISAKGNSTTNSFAHIGASTSLATAGSSVLPSLQYMLQQNNMQREQIIKLIRAMEQTSGQNSELSNVRSNDLLPVYPPISRERELQANVAQLQQSILNLVEELRRVKIKNAQLERRLNDLPNKEDKRVQNSDNEAHQ